MSDLFNVIWILFLLSALIPAITKRTLEARRRMFIDTIERKRGTRLITLIHRQETMSLLGIPISRYIDIEDSEKVLRAIRLTAEDVPIDVVLHTPGGLVLAAEQIARALCRHPSKVTVLVPHYAMSGGTLISLSADEIVMDPNGVLGPVDPQLQMPRGGGYVPAVSVLAALEVKNANRSDETLMMGDVARKAIQQVHDTVYGLLRTNEMDEESAGAIAAKLSEGCWTHDYPISADEAREMGLPISEEMPKEIYALMDLYPQSVQRRPSVEFVPAPRRSPGAPGGDDTAFRP